MRNSLVVALALCAIWGSGCSQPDPTPADAKPADAVPAETVPLPSAPQEKQPKPEFIEMLDPDWIQTRGVPRQARGTVTALGVDSLTLTFEPGVYTVIRPGPNGANVEVGPFTKPAEPPKEFKVSSLLAEGKAPKFHASEYRYRFADVRIGDRVSIHHHRRPNGDECCYRICIEGRPGDKIPAAPDEGLESFSRPYRWHEYRQAHQDFAEKGTPIPDKYLPQSERKTAPMPREVLHPRIPDAEQ